MIEKGRRMERRGMERKEGRGERRRRDVDHVL